MTVSDEDYAAVLRERTWSPSKYCSSKGNHNHSGEVLDTAGTDLQVMPPVTPMLAKPVTQLSEGPYSFEPRWDGFRTIIFRDGQEVVLGSRNERPLSRYFPELV
jgi:ATP-dependent DNA ligase